MGDKDKILSRMGGEVIPYFPCKIKCGLMRVDESILSQIEEIRIRAGKPVMLIYRGTDGFLHEGGQVHSKPCGAPQVSMGEIAEMVYKLCENSWYAYQEEINRGFITIEGGHRIGLVGTPIVEDGKIINIRDISSLNFRIAREVIGCGRNVVGYLINGNRDIYNTLIISPPGLGKTTLLRDIIRLLSDGFEPDFNGLKIGVVDERGEISASCRGIVQNDMGCRTDVIHGLQKRESMEVLLRSMSPNIIAMDELGNPGEVCTVLQMVNAGIRIIATAHGFNAGTLKMRQGFKSLFIERTFERWVILSKNQNLEYEIKIMDGDENVLAVDCQSNRVPAYYGEFYNGRLCMFPTAHRKDRMHPGNTGAFIGSGE